MADLTCPACGREVPPGEMQRGMALEAAPHPATVIMAFEILRAATRAGMFPKSAFADICALADQFAIPASRR